MRRKITYPEGTEIKKDILGNEVKILPNGVACTDNGDFNLKVAKYEFIDTMYGIVYGMSQGTNGEWYLDDGIASPGIMRDIKIFAMGLAASGKFVLQEWVDEVLANNTPLENIEKYLDENA